MPSFEEFSGTVTFDVDNFVEFFKTVIPHEEDTTEKESSEKKSFWDKEISYLNYSRKEKYFALNFLVNLAANGALIMQRNSEEKPGEVMLDISDLELDTLVHMLRFYVEQWNECEKSCEK